MTWREAYWVEFTKDHLVFSAAHFITFNGDCCERLHGHNYRVRARVQNPLDENHYVIDFIALRDTLQQLVNAWDHHVLLPTQHPLIRVVEENGEIVARYENRRWVFPEEDCRLLPVANTTTELLARELGQQLIQRLADRGIACPQVVEIGVDENHGQWGIWEGRGNG